MTGCGGIRMAAQRNPPTRLLLVRRPVGRRSQLPNFVRSAAEDPVLIKHGSGQTCSSHGGRPCSRSRAA